MGEALVLVCDRCGQPAVETVSFRAGGSNLVIDLCQGHLDELLVGARTPKRGRKPNTVTLATPKRAQTRSKAAPSKSGRKKTVTRRKPTAHRKATAKKRVSSRAK
jgi:hypothetical protein